MKKIVSVICIGLMSIFMLTACVSNQESDLEDKKDLQIVSTVFAGYDFAKQIVGDKADVSMLLSPGVESHSYEPSPQDIIKIQNSDIFIYVGGESEKWVEKILNSMDNKITTVKMMDLVEVYEEELVEGMQGEQDDDDHHEHEYDEHVWTSLRNAQSIVIGINEKISNLDEKNKDIYDENTKIYVEKLNGLDERFKELFSKSKKNTLIFGDRFPFRYFVEDYDLDYFAAFPGCSADTEPNASTIAFLIDKVKEKSINTVFYIEFSNHKIADTISEATDAKTAMIHSCHNVSIEDMDSGISYYSIMEKNYDTLKGTVK